MQSRFSILIVIMTIYISALNITVSQDGKSNFNELQQALNHIAKVSGNVDTVTITDNGIYSFVPYIVKGKTLLRAASGKQPVIDGIDGASTGIYNAQKDDTLFAACIVGLTIRNCLVGLGQNRSHKAFCDISNWSGVQFSAYDCSFINCSVAANIVYADLINCNIQIDKQFVIRVDKLHADLKGSLICANNCRIERNKINVLSSKSKPSGINICADLSSMLPMRNIIIDNKIYNAKNGIMSNSYLDSTVIIGNEISKPKQIGLLLDIPNTPTNLFLLNNKISNAGQHKENIRFKNRKKTFTVNNSCTGDSCKDVRETNATMKIKANIKSFPDDSLQSMVLRLKYWVY